MQDALTDGGTETHDIQIVIVKQGHGLFFSFVG